MSAQDSFRRLYRALRSRGAEPATAMELATHAHPAGSLELAIPPRLRTAAREKAAAQGQAMPHGGFPIRTLSELADAIRAWGRAADKDAAKAHILKRAKALGAGPQILARIQALGTGGAS